MTKILLQCTIGYQFFNGGCYDTAKRNTNVTVNVNLPKVMLKTLDKGVPIECISQPISFDPHDQLPNSYKQRYGIRFAGIHEPTKKPIFYGFDLFYQVSGGGLDLEQFLTFCFTYGFHIDWYNFQRTSIERGEWTLKTLIRKVSYPVLEVMGKEYWEQLKFRFQLYEWSLLEDNSEIKESYRHLFEKDK